MTDSQFLCVDRLAIHHHVIGAGHPLICLRGFGGSGDDWVDVAPMLSQHFRVHILDLPGFRKSSIPDVVEAPYRDAVGFLDQYLKAMKIERAVLVGHSMGGGIALEYAATFPSNTTALVVVDASGLGQDLAPIGRLLSHPMISMVLVQPVTFIIEAMWKSMFSDTNLVSSQMVMRTRTLLFSGAARRFYRQSMAAGVGFAGQRILVIDRISNIRALTLTVWGEQDSILPVSHAIAAHYAIPDSNLCILPDCGHMPQLEKPTEFGESVIEFLSALPSEDDK